MIDEVTLDLMEGTTKDSKAEDGAPQGTDVTNPLADELAAEVEEYIKARYMEELKGLQMLEVWRR